VKWTDSFVMSLSRFLLPALYIRTGWLICRCGLAIGSNTHPATPVLQRKRIHFLLERTRLSPRRSVNSRPARARSMERTALQRRRYDRHERGAVRPLRQFLHTIHNLTLAQPDSEPTSPTSTTSTPTARHSATNASPSSHITGTAV
jgi:hypothetical protein